MTLFGILDRLVREGDLTVVDWRGVRHRFGDGGGRPVAIRITDRATAWRIALDPHLALGEAYMDGRLVMEEGEIADLLDLIGRNMGRDFRGDPACGGCSGGCSSGTCGPGPAATSTTTTICPMRFMPPSSTRTASTAAPISSATTTASSAPRSRRSATSPPSF